MSAKGGDQFSISLCISNTFLATVTPCGSDTFGVLVPFLLQGNDGGVTSSLKSGHFSERKLLQSHQDQNRTFFPVRDVLFPAHLKKVNLLHEHPVNGKKIKKAGQIFCTHILTIARNQKLIKFSENIFVFH